MRSAEALGYESTGIALSLVVMSVAGLSFGFWLWFQRGSSDWPILWSILITSVLLLVPHSESYYLCLLILTFAIVLSRLCAIVRTWQWASVVVAYLVIAWPVPMLIVQPGR